MERTLFRDQVNGYDKDQVDNYIRKITEAYQTAYSEYLATCDKYNNLTQEYKKLESEKQDGVNAEIIAKTLLDSQKLAKEIINNAQNEGSRMIELTVKNLQYAYTTLENAMSEVQKFLTFNNASAGEQRDNSDPGGILIENEFEMFK